MLAGRRVALGVTGGIAAYKSAEIISRLNKLGAKTRAVMTEHAKNFITPVTLETLSGAPVACDMFSRAFEIEHIALAKFAEILVIAPATANILAKMAAGIADDMLSTLCLATTAPILVAPAMNSGMWNAPATRANVDTLAARGVRFVGPASGKLACGDEDIGRMEEPEVIVDEIERLISREHDLAGKRVTVTAGATREMLDPVRFLSNRSTGKMGAAIAKAARDRGAAVTVIAGESAVKMPRGVKVVRVISTVDLRDALMDTSDSSDIVIQSAAPADYRPRDYSEVKIKKTGEDMSIPLAPNPDAARELGARKRPGQVLVAFAAETNDVIENARGKLNRKNADLIVANDVTLPGAGFGTDTNAATLIARNWDVEISLRGKEELAHAILDGVLRIMNE